MEVTLAFSWQETLQALVLLAMLLFVVAGTTLRVHQRVLGYWLAAWGALLLTGALLLAVDMGFDGLLVFANLSDAMVAPLMLMGAYALVGTVPRFAWPLVVGAASGLLRHGLNGADAHVIQLLQAATVAPAMLVATARKVRSAPSTFELRRSIAVLLVLYAGVEVYDGLRDYQVGENLVVWGGLFAVCLPLAALQIAACILRIGGEIATAQAAQGAIREERDVANWRFDHVFAHVHELIAEIGEDTRVLYVNDRVRDVLGYSPDELVGRYAIDLVPESNRSAAAEAFRDQLKHGWEGEMLSMEVLALDGTLRDLDFSISRYGPSNDARMIVVIRDVTEQRARERDLEEHKSRLEARVEERTAALAASHDRLRAQERLAAVGTLASGIAHQINNPVGAISAAAEYALLAGDGEDGATIRKDSLRRIVDESARAGRIVRDILRFARHGETTKWPEDLAEVVRRSVEASRDYVADLGGRIEMDVSSVGLPVSMSPIEIEQMIVNLVYNAAESRKGGAHVVVSLDRSDDRAIVSVRDDGRGMTTEERSRAFDPFFTTRVREGGSGLGLAIVHGIVEDHAGQISIASAPGCGTTIRVEFPLAEASGDSPSD